jgi:hypothetical protein
MDWQSWIPIIISGLFVAFGAALWLWVRNLIKQFGDKLENVFGKIDYHTEKWMGVSNSNEMWGVIGEFGKEITETAEKMKNQSSFQPEPKPKPGVAGEGVTDLSNAVDKQSAASKRRSVAKNS